MNLRKNIGFLLIILFVVFQCCVCALTSFGALRSYQEAINRQRQFENSLELSWGDLDSDEIILFNETEYETTTIREQATEILELKCSKNELTHNSHGEDTRCFLENVSNANFTVNDVMNGKIMFVKFRNSSLGIVPTQLFTVFPKMRDLVMDNTSIEAIDQTSFASSPQLRFLILSHNKIESVMEGTFTEIPNISTLDLQSNRISIIHKDAFANLTQLKILQLNHNKLTILHPDTFNMLTSLRSIHLKDNQLQTLPSNLFSNIRSITYLDVSINRISSLPRDIFSNLDSFAYLNFDNNICVNNGFKKSSIFKENSLYDACMSDDKEQQKQIENYEKLENRIEAAEKDIDRFDRILGQEGSRKLNDTIDTFNIKLTKISSQLTEENGRKISKEVTRLENQIKETNRLNNEIMKSNFNSTTGQVVENTIQAIRKHTKIRYESLNTKIYIIFLTLFLSAVAICAMLYKLRFASRRELDRIAIV